MVDSAWLIGIRIGLIDFLTLDDLCFFIIIIIISFSPMDVLNLDLYFRKGYIFYLISSSSLDDLI